jgi:hypothetical protein
LFKLNTVTDVDIITKSNTSKPESYLIREVIRKMQSSGVGGGSSAGDERPEVGNTRSSPYASMSSRNCPNNVSENWRSATQYRVSFCRLHDAYCVTVTA